MSTNITGASNSFPAQFAIPSDGDKRDAASVNVAFQALADRTMTAATGQKYCPLNQPAYNLNSRFSMHYDTGEIVGWIQSDVTDEGGIHWYAPTPLRGSLVGIYANVHGQYTGAAHAAKPTTMPSLRIQVWEAGGSLVAEQTFNDASADAAAYDTWHQIGGALSAAQDLGTYWVHVRITGESGTNKLVDHFLVASVYLDIEAT